jgi:hypothetical protein
MTALLMTTLLFAVGIAFDLGTLFVAKRSLQEAVDAAAFGGAVAIYNGGATTTAIITNGAKADFTANGYSLTDPMIASQAWNWPPAAGNAKAGDVNYVEIIITLNVRVPLLPAQGGILPVTVRSTAGAVRQGSSYAIVTLNTTASRSLWFASNATVNINAGLVQVNSNCNNCSGGRYAVEKGSGTYNMGPGVTSKVVGGQSGFTAGQWTTGAAAVPDPLAGYLRPSTSGLTVYGAQNIVGDATLNPGIYTGNISISGPNGFGGCSSYTDVTFNPGMYILTEGLTAASLRCVNLTGTGVTFFNTQANYPTQSGGCTAFNLFSAGTYNISAPTTGYYFGMHIFQDPSCPATQPTLQVIMTSSITTSNGTIYAPNADVFLGTLGTLTIGGHVIVDTLQFWSSGTVNFNYNAGTAANALLPALIN